MPRATRSRLGRSALALAAAVVVCTAALAAPAGAADSTPSVTVSPDTGLVDGQTVTVTVAGFIPGEELVVERCGNQSPIPTPCVRQDVVFADANGAATTPLTVVRSLTDGHVPPVDCTATPGACVVNVSSLDGSRRVVVPLTFDSSVPTPPPPTLTVSASTGLTEGQSITLHATGFAPGAHLDYGVCAAGSFDISRCDVLHAQFGDADASGGFTAPLTVAATITVNGAPLDCTVAPGTCVVVVADGGDFSVNASVPLTFGTPPPPHHDEHHRPPSWWHRDHHERDDHHRCHRF